MKILDVSKIELWIAENEKTYAIGAGDAEVAYLPKTNRARAFAHLMATAPEMYQMLESLLKSCAEDKISLSVQYINDLERISNKINGG